MNENNNDENKNPSAPNLRFTVMPDLEGIGQVPDEMPTIEPDPVAAPSAPQPPVQSAPQPPQQRPQPPIASQAPRPIQPPAAPPQSSPRPAKQLTDDLKERREKAAGASLESGGSGRSRRIMTIGAASLLVVVLAGATVFAIWRNNKSESIAVTDQPTGATDQPADLGKDTDGDGLADKEEKEVGTDPKLADTDGDGLADGDEVRYFKTSPFTPHSDTDIYDDAKELQHGYNPLIGGDTKLTETEVADIVALINEGKLHSLSASTLRAQPLWSGKADFGKYDQSSAQGSNPDASAGQGFVYKDQLYNYELSLPGDWKRSGDSPTNILFIEKDSPYARYVQVQTFANLSGAESSGLLETEIKRLGAIAVSGVNYSQVKLGGLSAHRLVVETKRDSSKKDSPPLLGANVEYVIEAQEATFILTAACTSDQGLSCLKSVEDLGKAIEGSLKFS